MTYHQQLVFLPITIPKCETLVKGSESNPTQINVMLFFKKLPK